MKTKCFLIKGFFSILLVSLSINIFSQKRNKKPDAGRGFIHVAVQNLVMPDGKQFNIKGINLGNWLNPEGYMFLLPNSANSYRTIDQAFKEMVGEAVTNSFWQKFQNNYIKQEDIHYISQTGLNTIRLPFHYKLLTDEPFMGYSSKKHGFAVFDSVIGWCRQEGVYVILDMHDAPGGQTGDNIDDSYGYPWLFVTEQHKKQFCEIWQEIAEHYAKDPTILGYDVINEPIGSLFFPKDNIMLGVKLDSLYKRVSKDIREIL